MKQIFFLGFLCLMIACQNAPETDQQEPETSTVADTPNTLSEQEKSEGWQLLFDGTSTGQWKSYGKEDFPPLGWVIQNNDLVLLQAPSPRPESFGGDIITREKFGDFELKIDFMLSDTANSGIFYFVTEEEGKPIWINAPEYQLLDDATYIATGQVEKQSTHLTGSNYDLQSCAGSFNKPAGEWNTARIIHRDGHVEHWLNGKKCLEYQVGSEEWENLVSASKFSGYEGYGRSATGHIGLQDHNHEVRFRNLKIRAL